MQEWLEVSCIVELQDAETWKGLVKHKLSKKFN